MNVLSQHTHLEIELLGQKESFEYPKWPPRDGIIASKGRYVLGAFYVLGAMAGIGNKPQKNLGLISEFYITEFYILLGETDFKK